MRLNLLSPEKRRYMNRIVAFIYLKNVLEMFLFVLTISGILFVGGRWFLQDYYNEVSSQMVRISNENVEINRKIKMANNTLESTSLVQEDYVLWTPVLTKISKVVPANIIIDSMVLDKNSKSYTFTGKAKTRDDLLAFQNALQEFESINRVDLPLSQLTEKNDVPFIITATFK